MLMFIEVFCKGYFFEFLIYFNFCCFLWFDDKFDYFYLCQFFCNFFYWQGFFYDYVFDWNMLKFGVVWNFEDVDWEW